MRKTALSLSCLIWVAVALSGCGIKPSFVDPPQGYDKDHFPRTYPSTPAPQ